MSDSERTPQAVKAIVAVDLPRHRLRRIGWSIALAAVVAALASLWIATPLREWIDVGKLVEAAHRLGTHPLAVLVIIGAFVIGGLVIAPANVMISATVVVLGPIVGAACALIGVLLSAAVLYEIGRLLPAERLRVRFGPLLRSLGGRLARNGVVAIVLVRIVPVGPYSVVNLICGAAHVDRTTYLAGTALGMLPGIVLTAVFIDRLLAAIDQPGPWTWALLALFAAAIASAFVAARRYLRRVVASGG